MIVLTVISGDFVNNMIDNLVVLPGTAKTVLREADDSLGT